MGEDGRSGVVDALHPVDLRKYCIDVLCLVVRVSGNVVNPGLLSFEPGRDFTFYIEKAGGYSWRASKGEVRVIKEVTGEWIKPGKSTRIHPGDTIWIPEKPDRDYWGFFKDTMIVLGNVATFYLVISEAVK